VGALTAADIAPLSNLQRLKHLCLTRQVLGRSDTGLSKLLAALQHLTQLQHLKLSNMVLHRVSVQGSSSQTFFALTASTQLTALDLVDYDSTPVPPAAFQHIFPTGRVLPHLRVLILVGHPAWHCVGAAQVAMIAASCPALKELTLAGVTPEGFDVSCLAQLPPGVTQVRGLGWTRPVL
jgi:hypothetical protein